MANSSKRQKHLRKIQAELRKRVFQSTLDAHSIWWAVSFLFVLLLVVQYFPGNMKLRLLSVRQLTELWRIVSRSYGAYSYLPL